MGISEQAKPFGIKRETLAGRFMTSNRPCHFQLSSGRIGSSAVLQPAIRWHPAVPGYNRTANSFGSLSFNWPLHSGSCRIANSCSSAKAVVGLWSSSRQQSAGHLPFSCCGMQSETQSRLCKKVLSGRVRKAIFQMVEERLLEAGRFKTKRSCQS